MVTANKTDLPPIKLFAVNDNYLPLINLSNIIGSY